MIILTGSESMNIDAKNNYYVIDKSPGEMCVLDPGHEFGAYRIHCRARVLLIAAYSRDGEILMDGLTFCS